MTRRLKLTTVAGFVRVDVATRQMSTLPDARAEYNQRAFAL